MVAIVIFNKTFNYISTNVVVISVVVGGAGVILGLINDSSSADPGPPSTVAAGVSDGSHISRECSSHSLEDWNMISSSSCVSAIYKIIIIDIFHSLNLRNFLKIYNLKYLK